MFQKARLKLTAWYLLIILLVCFILSAEIFRVQMSEVNRFARAQRVRLENQFPLDPSVPRTQFAIDPDLVAETQARLLINLLVLDGVIIVISGVFGYFLAGKTLYPIKAMLEEQKRFVSDSSHELRTPLTSLKSAMEVALMDKNLSLDEAKKLIEENIEDINRLQKLSDSLIQLTKEEKVSTKHLNAEKLSTSSLIKASIAQIKPQAKIKKIQIKQNIKNASLKGDKDKIINLLVILLDNAVKYSPENSTITIKTWKTKNFAYFSVKDLGIGIAKKDLPHIFDRFYRADTSRSNNKTPGYGLGLSIAKMIAEDHKGSISVKNNAEHGTIFLVRLPANAS